MASYCFNPIGVIETPFKEKFGIPRQAGIVTAATGLVRLQGRAASPEAVEGLEGFSHLWLTWVFHAVPEGEWQTRVRPPRLGGNRRVGVFASRSPFRPNPLGLSVVRLDSISSEEGVAVLHISGVDMLHGTPLLDIKPYVPYSDSCPEALAGFAPTAPDALLDVIFTPEAQACLDKRPDADEVRAVIEGVVGLDPRPAYKRDETEGEYGMRLYDFDLRWRVTGREALILSLESRI